MKKGIVPQVGYLQRLYRDARSTEHKKQDIRLQYNTDVIFVSYVAISVQVQWNKLA